MSEELRISGKLMSLPTLMHTADCEAWTAVVEVAPHGEIRFVDGEVVGARRGELRGVDAWYELFLDTPEAYVGRGGHVAGTSLGIHPSTMLEAVRRADEWERLSATGCTLRAGAEPPDLPPWVRRLDGRALAEEAARLRVPRNRLVDLVTRLVADGVLQLVEPTAEAPAPRPQASQRGYNEWLEAGRRAFRAKNHDEAVAAFEAALDCRPGDRIAAQNLRRARQRADSAASEAAPTRRELSRAATRGA
jgi:hypothetical protein